MKAIQATAILLMLTSSLLVGGCTTADREQPTRKGGAQMFAEADNYERFMGRWSRHVAPQLAEFARVESGDRVLDVGTGTGALAVALLEESPLIGVTGIDPSSKYIEHATARIGDPRAVFEVGDAQAMRYADRTFDCCLSLLVVNFIPDPAKAVREMRRVTKRGGTVAAAVWDYGDGMRMLRVFWDEAVSLDPGADPLDERHMPFCGRNELIGLWEAAGLEEVEAVGLTFDQQFDSFEDYWAPFLLGTGPAGAYVASLDQDRRIALENKLRRRLLAGQPDGSFDLPCRAWAVRGRVR